MAIVPAFQIQGFPRFFAPTERPMYAVIQTGGKQYKVAANDVISIEKIDGEAGAEVAFDEVLMLADESGVKVGTPTVQGAVVTATVLEQGRADKVIVFKKKRRQNYRRKHGHQQLQTVLRIAGISADGAPKPKAKAKTAAKPKAEAAEQAKED